MYDLRGAVANKPAQMENQGVFGRVAVWLEGENTNDCRPVTANMNQIGRHFEPDLLIVPAGSKVSFPNLDPVFHNVFSLSHTRDFDLGYYPQGKSPGGNFFERRSRPGLLPHSYRDVRRHCGHFQQVDGSP